jgi:hypothetical protein
MSHRRGFTAAKVGRAFGFNVVGRESAKEDSKINENATSFW